MSRRAPQPADARGGSHALAPPAEVVPAARDRREGRARGNPPAAISLLLGVLALICGLLSFLFAATFLAALFGALAILLGLAGFLKARQRQGRGRGTAAGGLIAGLLGVALAVLAAVGLPPSITGAATDVDRAQLAAPAPPVAPPPPQAQEQPPPPDAPAPAPAPRRAQTASAAPAAPPAWRTFATNRGYTLRYPPRWQVRRLGPTQTEFSDPATGMYLRVLASGGPLRRPATQLREMAPAFAATHSNYRQLAIRPTAYKGFDAAVWQYSYTDGGARLRADYETFNTRRSAYTLNFQTHQHDWRAAQGVYRTLRSAFRVTP